MDHPHGNNWRRWLSHLIGRPAYGMEIGTFRGESAEWMCRNIFTHRDCLYACVDHFRGGDDHRFAGVDCAGLEAETRRRLDPFPQSVVIAEDSREVLPRLISDGLWRFDFIYVDGSHVAEDTLRDLVFAWELLKPGGVMVIDDYLWDVMPDPLDRPRVAVDAFLSIYARRLEVVEIGSQACVRKR